MSARPEEPPQRRLRTLFLSAFAVFVIASCCTGRLPQPLTNFGQDCGSVNVGPNGTIEGDPQPAENCLVAAFTHCQVASLAYNHAGIDTGERHQLQVVPAARGCLIEDRSSGWSVIPRLNISFNAPPLYTCESVQSVEDGLAVKGCNGENDFVIPRYPAIIGHLCGYVTNLKGETHNDPSDALRCFWQAYIRCQAATLRFTSDKIRSPSPDSYLHPEIYISFQRSNGACVVSVVEWLLGEPTVPRTCAELIKRSDQLLVSACGALGDVVLPLAPGSPPP